VVPVRGTANSRDGLAPCGAIGLVTAGVAARLAKVAPLPRGTATSRFAYAGAVLRGLTTPRVAKADEQPRGTPTTRAPAQRIGAAVLTAYPALR
jgi:hypothetical protein